MVIEEKETWGKSTYREREREPSPRRRRRRWRWRGAQPRRPSWSPDGSPHWPSRTRAHEPELAFWACLAAWERETIQALRGLWRIETMEKVSKMEDEDGRLVMRERASAWARSGGSACIKRTRRGLEPCGTLVDVLCNGVATLRAWGAETFPVSIPFFCLLHSWGVPSLTSSQDNEWLETDYFKRLVETSCKSHDQLECKFWSMQ